MGKENGRTGWSVHRKILVPALAALSFASIHITTMLKLPLLEGDCTVISSPRPNDEPLLPMIIPIVMEGTGELGNHLYKIVYGKSVEYIARDSFNISTRLIMRDHRFHKYREASGTFTRSREVMMGCFPNISRDVEYDFYPHRRTLSELKSNIAAQSNWLGKDLAGKLFLKQGTSFDHIQESLGHLYQIMKGMKNSGGNEKKNCSQTVLLKDGTKEVAQYTCLPPPSQGGNSSTFDLPFIFLEDLGTATHMDRFYEKMRNFLYFNESGMVGPERHSCCKQSPEDDETVFHFRNFHHEVHKSFLKKGGFIELGPEKTANELFKDLKKGDRLAMATRFGPEVSSRTQEYLDALERRGISVRVVSGQEPYQDFCFLKRSRKGLVGSAFSTFSSFAGFLSDDRSLKMMRYSVEVPKWPKEENVTWTNPELKSRIKFGLYKP